MLKASGFRSSTRTRLVSADGFGYRMVRAASSSGSRDTATVIVEDDVEIGACCHGRPGDGAAAMAIGMGTTDRHTSVMIAHNCEIGGTTPSPRRTAPLSLVA